LRHSVVATPCPDMSVAKSVSVDPGTSMSVDFDDCNREIQLSTAMSESADLPAETICARPVPGNPSISTFARCYHGYVSLLLARG